MIDLDSTVNGMSDEVLYGSENNGMSPSVMALATKQQMDHCLSLPRHITNV